MKAENLGALYTHTHTSISNKLRIKKGNYNFLNKVEVVLACIVKFTQVFIITKQINEARISVN